MNWLFCSFVVLYEVHQRELLTLGRGTDFDDPEYGVKEEDKDPRKVTASRYHILYITKLIKRPRPKTRNFYGVWWRIAMESMERWNKQCRSSRFLE